MGTKIKYVRARLLPPMLIYKPTSTAGGWEQELRQLFLFQPLGFADLSQAWPQHDSVSTSQSLCLAPLQSLKEEHFWNKQGRCPHLGHSARTTKLGQVPEGCGGKAGSKMPQCESTTPASTSQLYCVCRYSVIVWKRRLWSSRFGMGPEVCISDKLSGDGHAASSWITHC